MIWNELEEFLKVNQDKSERHKSLYNHVKKIRMSSIKNESVLNKIEKLDHVITPTVVAKEL